MSRRRAYTESIVWLTLAALAALAYLGYRIHKALPHNVFNISPDRVVEITISSPERNCTIKLINGTWYFTSPQKGKAVPPRVSELLDQIKQLKDKRSPVELENEAIYGLDKPSLIVKYTSKKGKEFKIVYGGKSSTSAFRIAKIYKNGKTDGKAHFFSHYIFTTYKSFLNDLPMQKEEGENTDTYSG